LTPNGFILSETNNLRFAHHSSNIQNKLFIFIPIK